MMLVDREYMKYTDVFIIYYHIVEMNYNYILLNTVIIIIHTHNINTAMITTDHPVPVTTTTDH